MWNFLRKEKKNIFAKFDTRSITDSKTFKQTVKPFFSDKTLDSDQITLINNGKIILDDENIAKTFNDFFSNVVKYLNIKVGESLLNQNLDLIEDPVLGHIKCYKNHPSIKRTGIQLFSTFTDIEQQLKHLNPIKVSQDTDIPTRILKENSDPFVQVALKNYNEVISISTSFLTYWNMLILHLFIKKTP